MFEKMNPTKGKMIIKSSKLAQRSPSRGWARLALSLAKIISVHTQEMKVNIEIITGEQGKPIYEGVDLTMPAQGARHFLGAFPDLGDYCVVGWFASDSDGQASSKSPAILAWFPPAHYLGQEWVMAQAFGIEEGILNTSSDRDNVKGVAQRIRHRRRHYEPGNVGALSSQGSDLLLDESVTLSNRRANEIKLRDQDQALVVRSIQQFHAMGGARIYGGHIQRDARLLPNEMFSDGTDWNARIQVDDILEFLSEGDLAPSSDPEGLLTPAIVFDSKNGMLATEGSNSYIDASLNPYSFLYSAGLIDSAGYALTDTRKEVYGGKSVLRLDARGNNTFSGGSSLTEYRIEMDHTHDGTLPVTEQTEGFDSDRVPKGSATPIAYIEWVLGSVVGNNPHGEKERLLYGRPLVADVRSGNLLNGTDTQIDDHLASFFRVNPVNLTEDLPSYTGFTKAGAFRAYIGNSEIDAVDINIAGGLNLTAGGEIKLTSDVKVTMAGGFQMVSESQPLKIFAGGTSREDANPDIEFNPSLELGGKDSVVVRANEGVLFETPKVSIQNSSVFKADLQENIDFKAGESIKMQTKRKVESINGKVEISITGPADFNPLNAPIKKEQILANPLTGHVGGPTDVYEMLFGDKTETIGIGNRRTTVAVGTISNTVGVGSITNTVGVNNTAVTTAGITLTAGLGAISIGAAAGPISLTSSLAITQKASTIQLSAGLITLSAPGSAPPGSFIMGSFDRDATTGLPFVTFNPAPKGQLLSNVLL